jgi:hypothetical protein
MNLYIGDMTTFPLLIAVSGKLGTGKDYITENMILPAVAGTVSRMAFADHIKVNVASQSPEFTLTQCLTGEKSAELRHKLQTAGTAEGRDLYGADIWVTTLENWIRLRQLRDGGPEVVLVTDCRFENEANWILRHGGLLIRVVSPELNASALDRESGGDPELRACIASHVSETALDNYDFPHVVYNSRGSPTIAGAVADVLRQYIRSHPEHSRLLGHQ